MLSVGELVTLDATRGLFSVFGSTEEYSSSGWETYLRAIVLCKLSFVVAVFLIEFDFPEDSFSSISNGADGVDGVILGDCN